MWGPTGVPIWGSLPRGAGLSALRVTPQGWAPSKPSPGPRSPPAFVLAPALLLGPRGQDKPGWSRPRGAARPAVFFLSPAPRVSRRDANRGRPPCGTLPGPLEPWGWRWHPVRGSGARLGSRTAPQGSWGAPPEPPALLPQVMLSQHRPLRPREKEKG